VRTLAQHVDNNLFLIRLPAWLLFPLGPVALVLAGLGIYSVVSYSVAQRTQEIGVRLSLGATPARVVSMILRQGLGVVGVGLGLGLVFSFACNWVIAPTLVAVRTGDPGIFVGVPTLLFAIGLLACWMPARRASVVNPVEALRVE